MATQAPDKNLEAVKQLAKDLTKDFPRSPREKVGGYVLAARMLDKCRAELAGVNGEYHFDCPLDNILLEFTGIEAKAFQDFVATGADDEAVGQWIKENAKQTERESVILWNNQLLDKSLSDMPTKIQVFMEDYVQQYVPKGKIIYRFFDIYDYEEGRL